MDSSSPSPFISIQKSYDLWLKLRRVSIPLFQDLVNLKNKVTYVHQMKLDSVLGGISSSSTKVSMQIYDEISDVISSIDEMQSSMQIELEKIQSMMMTQLSSSSSSSSSRSRSSRRYDAGLREGKEDQKDDEIGSSGSSTRNDDPSNPIKEEFPVDEAVLEGILSQCKSQLSLEITLFQRLRDSKHGGEKDQDLSVTILACLNYPSYLKIDDLKLLIDFKSGEEK